MLLATELAVENARIVRLKSDAKTLNVNLTAARSVAQESRTEVYDLEGDLKNLRL